MDGRRLASEIRQGLAAEMARLGWPAVTLATVLVGGDPMAESEVALKHREAEAAGLRFRHLARPATATQHQVEEAVAAVAGAPDVHGVFVQLPLPAHLDAGPVLDLVPPLKDVDGLSRVNLGRLVRGEPGHVPGAPAGVVRLLRRYEVPLPGRRAVIVGRPDVFSLPLMMLLIRLGATVTIVPPTADLAGSTSEADILVAAAGTPGLITAGHVKAGAAVVDAGVTRTDAGIQGDVAFEEVQAVAGAITPMPGGTGPMTVACLLENTLEAARRQGAV